jgi:hypothetical protein
MGSGKRKLAAAEWSRSWIWAWVSSSSSAQSGREKETFFTRLVGAHALRGDDCEVESSSEEQIEFVGEGTLVSAVQVRELTEPEGEWRLEEQEEVTEPDRVLVATEFSAAWMRVVARS